MIHIHEHLYGDPKRVARLRVQAKGRIGLRQLRYVLILSWAIPVMTWLENQLQDVSEVKDRDD